MVVTVGSMQILCVLRDQGVIAALGVVKSKVAEVGSMAKNTTVELGRMSQASGLLGKMLGAIGIGGFVGLLMAAPRTTAEMTKLMNHLRQIALIMDKYVAPVVGWLADAIGWLADKFKALPEPIQGAVTYLFLLAGAFGMASIAAKLLGLDSVAASAMGLARSLGVLLTTLSGTTLGMTLLGIALGLVAAYVLDWAMRASGFNDWLDNASAKGNEFASVLNFILTPIRLFADIINIALGRTTWDTFIEDINRAKTAIEDMGGVLGTMIDLLGLMPGAGGLIVGNEVRNYVMGTGSYRNREETSEYYAVPQNVNGGKGPTVVNISNNFGGVEVKNDMDLDTFAEENSKRQAQKLSWMGY